MIKFENCGYNRIKVEEDKNFFEITALQLQQFLAKGDGYQVNLSNDETDIDNQKVHTDFNLKELKDLLNTKFDKIIFTAKVETVEAYVILEFGGADNSERYYNAILANGVITVKLDIVNFNINSNNIGLWIHLININE